MRPALRGRGVNKRDRGNQHRLEERSEGIRRFPPPPGETCLSCFLLVLLPGGLVLLVVLAVTHHL
jgi:hypothetical protein